MKKGVDISRGSTYLLVNKHSQEFFYPGKKRLGITYLLVNKYWKGVPLWGGNINDDTRSPVNYTVILFSFSDEMRPKSFIDVCLLQKIKRVM